MSLILHAFWFITSGKSLRILVPVHVPIFCHIVLAVPIAYSNILFRDTRLVLIAYQHNDTGWLSTIKLLDWYILVVMPNME